MRGPTGDREEAPSSPSLTKESTPRIPTWRRTSAQDLSTSFAEDCTGGIEDWQPEPGFYFNHGTHVAGIVAAADNAFGVVGVARNSLGHGGGCALALLGAASTRGYLDGIGDSAADHAPMSINMSLGSGP